MRKLSVKSRLTIWITLLMALLAGLLLAFMLSISSAVSTQSAMDQLARTVRGNLSHIATEDGRLSLGEDFQFYHSGVSTLIYSS